MVECIDCGSTNTVKAGFRITKKGRRQKYLCNDCGHTFCLNGR